MGTRPDISHAVAIVAKYCNDPKNAHWLAVKRIIRYLAGTRDFGILYKRQTNTGKTNTMPVANFSASSPCKADVDMYVDADFANDLDDARSITGYIFLFAGGPLSWQSRTQLSTALSTMEAEYMAAAAATQEALWLRMILEELGISMSQPLLIHEDNNACIHFTEHPGEHKRTKHINYRYHFVRERVQSGEIKFIPIDSKEQIADILTKTLEPGPFKTARDRLVVSKSAVLDQDINLIQT